LAGFPGGTPLVRDYIQGESHLARFYCGSFREARAYEEKAKEVDSRFHLGSRERAASIVSAPHPEAARRLSAFVEGGGYFVTTGQQPGLFSGPLYSFYKALTAVKLAEVLEPVLKRTVLPLFWVASEDHDWAEVDHTNLVDRDNELRTVRLPMPEGIPNRPLKRITLGEGVNEALGEFLQALPETDFSADLFESILESYTPEATLPRGFRALMEDVLSDLPLLYVDAGNPELKAASQATLLRELECAEEHEFLLSRVAAHLEMDGYHAQVPILPGGVNLFLEGPEGRDRVYREESGFKLHHAGTTLSEADIRSRVESDPSILSPNVLLRPIVESTVFPTVSYIGGPGEIAYFAQLRELFEAHGIKMPVVHPRFSVTLVESKVQKVLDKFHFSVEHLHRPHHELAGEIAREEIPPEVRRALGEVRGAVGKGGGALLSAIKGIDPTLKGPVTHARNAAFGAFDEAERKILQAVKRENQTALGQLEKAQLHLFPEGKPQERMINAFYYLTRYGPGLVNAILSELMVDLGTQTA
jgi:bacillithiol biosynthesis cysteine-adding enzyme BshC